MTIEKFIGTPYFNGKTIVYNAVIEYHFDSGRRTDVETQTLSFHNDGFIFANEFLAVMNKKFGTTYQFSESYKDEVGKKHGNIHSHKDFALRDTWGGKYELLHHYDYDSVKNCTSTYGDYSKEELIKFADAVDAYNKGVVRTTEFNPTYSMADKVAQAEVDRTNAEKAIQNEIDDAVNALKKGLEGDALTKATKAVEEGYRWSRTRILDKYHDTKHNIHLDEMEVVTRETKKSIKRYKDYFDDEVVNNKRECYYSTDDRYHTWVGMRYTEKNNRDNYFSIAPIATDNGIRFSFVGEICHTKWGADEETKHEFDLKGLTFEELLEVNNLYNEMWHDAMWGK